MQLHEIENWALQIIDAVNDGRPNEDSRVELKSDWPTDIDKVARQIAGHANASKGAPILWLIGVDEINGVAGVARNDVATWYPQVTSKFDGFAPDLTDLNVITDEKTVVALFLETSRRPFVVKNPKHGQQGGGSVALEVPWREGTRTRTAKRDDLIRLLSPLQPTLEFEVLSARLFCREQDDEYEWDLFVSLYAEMEGEATTVIPYHRSSVSAIVPEDNKIVFTSLRLHPPYLMGGRETRNLSKTIESGADEVIIYAPGKLILKANERLKPSSFSLSGSCEVSILLSPVLSTHPIPLTFSMDPSSDVDSDMKAKWEL